MSDSLQQAIKSFCQLIPEVKIGVYSPQPMDDQRLKNILKTALKNNEEVKPKDIQNCLRKCHPKVAEKDIIECAESAFKYMLEL